MPKNTFLSLSNKKQKEMIDSAFVVFSKYGFKKTSIDDLMKALNITRTAFYYYFYNKEDLYAYLVELAKEDFIKNYIYNKDEKYSLEEIFIKLFIYLSQFKQTDKEEFFIDLFNNISIDRQNNLIEKLLGEKASFTHFQGFSSYRFEDKDQASEITFILFSIVYREILVLYKTDISFDDAYSSLIKKIDLIQYGIIKGE